MDTLYNEDALGARYYLYRLFQRLFGDDPTEEAIVAIDASLVQEALQVLDVQDADDSLEGFLRACETARSAEGLEQARRDFMHLFVGPATVLAPPWESVYRSKQRLLMTEDTLAVRAFFRAHGYVLQTKDNVPDDHLATELDFMALLAERALAASREGSEADCAALLEISAGFLREHLGVWVDDFAAKVQSSAPESLYAHCAALLVAVVAADLKGMQKAA